MSEKAINFLARLVGVGLLATSGLVVAGIIGWVLNFSKLIQLCLSYNGQLGELVMRVVGIFPPIGAVAGWL